MKFKTLGCELRRRLCEQEQKNENIRKSCKLDQLFVRQSFQQRQSQDTESSAVPASNSVEEHAEHSEQRSFEQQLSAMIKPIFATMQRDNTVEHEGSSEINRQSVTGPDVADPAYNADVEMKCR